MKTVIVFGHHAIQALLQHHPEQIRKLQYQESMRDSGLLALLKSAKQQGISVEISKKQTLEKLTNGANHQGLVAHCVEQAAWQEVDLLAFLQGLEKPAFLLLLDGVQDPHNLGACLRSAYAAGVHAVIAPKDRSVGLTPVVRKVACGAAELLPFVQVTNLSRTMKDLKALGVWFVGAEMQQGEPLYNIDMTGSIAWVLGAEGKGLRENTKKHCDYLGYIPMPNPMESLNVSVAAGICLFEVVRQRQI